VPDKTGNFHVTAAQAFSIGYQEVSESARQPGDIVFFAEVGDPEQAHEGIVDVDTKSFWHLSKKASAPDEQTGWHVHKSTFAEYEGTRFMAGPLSPVEGRVRSKCE
jgi:hypothetical protein